MKSDGFSLNCKGSILDINSPQVMGILNVTPDSFFDGGIYSTTDFAVDHARKMIAEGASIIDVGGMSSRPGADYISISEELDRVLPVIDKLSHERCYLSIDTIHPEVARQALDIGAHIVNDISGGLHDESIFDVCTKYNAPYIMMHMQGSPKTMQQNPHYSKGVMYEVLLHFIAQLEKAAKRGLFDIVLDPGFGFGKTVEHNYEILAKAKSMAILNRPWLAGISRKSMIGKVLGVSPSKGLPGTIAANTLALVHGASILRVHDVKEAQDTIKIFTAFKNHAT